MACPDWSGGIEVESSDTLATPDNQEGLVFSIRECFTGGQVRPHKLRFL